MEKGNPYGDDAGTRVGKPDVPKRANMAGAGNGGKTGSGKESTGGVARDGRPDSPRRPRSESLKNEGVDTGSGYGGDHDSPKTSRDQH
jgi:hypothetical protein